jgi:Uma2 family endonuclease
MARPASHLRATYEDVVNAKPDLVAEILGGELVLTPRPAPMHALAGGRLFATLSAPFVDAMGGPGGWVMLPEPELHFATRGLEVLVPDVAGWRRERLTTMPQTPAIHVAPDWVCEILSPSTEKIDRTRKMDVYAREQVGHLWFLDPRQRQLEAYALVGGTWESAGNWADPEGAGIRAAPFEAVSLDLAKLWKW